MEEKTFLSSLISLHEHNSIVMRGKCLLTFLLLFKQDYRWISVVHHQVKFFTMLERALKDSFKYVQCCLICLGEGIVELVPQIFKTVADAMQQELNKKSTHSIGKQPQDSLSNKSGFATQQDLFSMHISAEVAHRIKQGGNMFQLSSIIDILSNSFIRSKIMTPSLIRALTALLDNTSLLLAAGEYDTQLCFEF